MNLKICSRIVVAICCWGFWASSAATIEATVIGVSKIPDPQSSPYEDCNYTLQLQTQDKLRINLLLPAFRHRQLVSAGQVTTGNRIQFEGIPFADADSSVVEVQAVDDFSDFDIALYYTSEIKVITSQSIPPTASAPSTTKRKYNPDVKNPTLFKLPANYARIQELRARIILSLR